MRKLTSYTLASLVRGEHVYYRGDRWEVTGRGYHRVFLRCLETGKPHVALTSEIRAYTDGLREAARQHAAVLLAHAKQVRARAYTSVYFPPAPKTPYDYV
jgi:hypothetical protein